jgi:hypothetical protein
MILMLDIGVSRKRYFAEELTKETSHFLKCFLTCRAIKEVRRGKVMLKNKGKDQETSNTKIHPILKDQDHQFKRHQEVPLSEQEVAYKALPSKTKVNLRFINRKVNNSDQVPSMKVANIKEQLLEAIFESKTNYKIDKVLKQMLGSQRNSNWSIRMTKSSTLQKSKSRSMEQVKTERM